MICEIVNKHDDYYFCLFVVAKSNVVLFIFVLCRCCQECARTEGEPCGGDQGFSGTCEPGLSCQQPGLSPNVGICRPIVFDTGENTWKLLHFLMYITVSKIFVIFYTSINNLKQLCDHRILLINKSSKMLK